MGVESYLHKYAKVVVASWLRRKIRIGTKFKGLNNIPLDLKIKEKGPMFGVYTEFPVCKVIDEQNNVLIGIDCTWEEWLIKQGESVKSKSKIPTLYELQTTFKNKLKILAIFDLVIIDEKRLKYVFEIEHTHPSTSKKIRFIKDHGLIGYEISAQKVMEQVKLPYTITILNEWNVT